MPSATLLPEDKTLIRMAIEIFSATVCRLYVAAPDRSAWTHIATGAISFMKDMRKNDAFFFRFVNLKSGSVVWEQEVYQNFQYTQDRPFFHSFAGDECMIGLSFADEHEALAFYSKVLSRESLRVQRKRAPSSALKAQPIGSATAVVSPSASSKNKKDKGGKPKIDKNAIGLPTNFRHLTHVGYNPETGFSTMNVPPEWKKVFDKAGVTEEQLQDQNTAKFIFDFMKQHGGVEPGDISAPEPAARPAAPPPVAVPARPAPEPFASRKPPPVPPSRGQPSGPAPTKQPPPPPPARDKRASLSEAPPTPQRPPAPPVAERPPPVSVVSPKSPVSPVAPVSPPIMAGGAPPPPPPPPVVEATPAAPLPKPSAEKKTSLPVPDSRTDLLASIREAGTSKLKPVSQREIPEPKAAPEPVAGDIASALRAALMARQTAIGKRADDDDEEEEEDDDEW